MKNLIFMQWIKHKNRDTNFVGDAFIEKKVSWEKYFPNTESASNFPNISVQ